MPFGEMRPQENKARIVNQLFRLLRMTRDQEALVSLEYTTTTTHEEAVVATYRSGRKQEINVSMDSGIALIRDVVRALR